MTPISTLARRLGGLLAALALSVGAFAAAQAAPYAEVRVSYFQTGTFSGDVKLPDDSTERASFKEDSAISPGIEIGINEVGASHISLSLSYDRVELENESPNVFESGTDVSATDVRVGTLKREADLYGINAYHHWQPDESVRPFLGLFVGTADIKVTRENSDLKDSTGSVTVWGLKTGAQVDITDSTYLNLRSAWYRAEDRNVLSASVALGYRF